jgi:hypothetical protein
MIARRGEVMVGNYVAGVRHFFFMPPRVAPSIGKILNRFSRPQS